MLPTMRDETHALSTWRGAACFLWCMHSANRAARCLIWTQRSSTNVNGLIRAAGRGGKLAPATDHSGVNQDIIGRARDGYGYTRA